MGEIAGRFHYGNVVHGTEALREWRVTAGRRDCADQVSRLLDGEVIDGQADAGWEVRTTATAVRVVVESTDEMSLAFRLADDRGLGVFEFRSHAWNVAELMGNAVSQLSTLDGPGLCELGIGSVIVTTLGGRQVRFHWPSLRVVGPWTCAA